MGRYKDLPSTTVFPFALSCGYMYIYIYIHGQYAGPAGVSEKYHGVL